jgi:hypothetical protein
MTALGIDVKYSADRSQCIGFESENIRFERMQFGCAGELLGAWNDPLNYTAYGSTSLKTMDGIAEVIEKDIARPYFTGYAMFSKITKALLGRAAIGSGYHPKNDIEGAYTAAPLVNLVEGAGEGPAEVQIGDFLVSDESKLGKPRAEMYKEMLLALLFAANEFINWYGREQNGQPVRRVTITVIDPEKSDFSDVAGRDLAMRHGIIREVFGEPMGKLLPKSVDRRNYSEHERFVFGCDKTDLSDLLESHGIV